jgi:hypothetical protein
VFYYEQLNTFNYKCERSQILDLCWGKVHVPISDNFRAIRFSTVDNLTNTLAGMLVSTSYSCGSRRETHETQKCKKCEEEHSLFPIFKWGWFLERSELLHCKVVKEVYLRPTSTHVKLNFEVVGKPMIWKRESWNIHIPKKRATKGDINLRPCFRPDANLMYYDP